MYVDFRNDGPPPEPWKPERPKARLTGRQEKLLVWIVCFNLLMLFLGPLAGVTLLDAVIAYFRG
ncbi:hypothetical protein [Aureimonas pseudogalii]|jgi:hypothetical protein|uniref:Uncharacterized protein n=1 Tax=Aureimonas pseudogalii TaxID=1744844 RepID=A0A7W6H362_9HYPH|nr:hypothetical protein [Aureimonas pseudogalii]MBB3996842.1 hypothetical protein [Aureimonas pseudogalii]